MITISQPKYTFVSPLQIKDPNIIFSIGFQNPAKISNLYRNHIYSLYLILLLNGNASHRGKAMEKINCRLQMFQKTIKENKQIASKLETLKQYLQLVKSQLSSDIKYQQKIQIHNAQKIASLCRAFLIIYFIDRQKEDQNFFNYTKWFSNFIGVECNVQDYIDFQLIFFNCFEFQKQRISVTVEINKITQSYKYIKRFYQINKTKDLKANQHIQQKYINSEARSLFDIIKSELSISNGDSKFNYDPLFEILRMQESDNENQSQTQNQEKIQEQQFDVSEVEDNISSVVYSKKLKKKSCKKRDSKINNIWNTFNLLQILYLKQSYDKININPFYLNYLMGTLKFKPFWSNFSINCNQQNSTRNQIDKQFYQESSTLKNSKKNQDIFHGSAQFHSISSQNIDNQQVTTSKFEPGRLQRPLLSDEQQTSQRKAQSKNSSKNKKSRLQYDISPIIQIQNKMEEKHQQKLGCIYSKYRSSIMLVEHANQQRQPKLKQSHVRY